MPKPPLRQGSPNNYQTPVCALAPLLPYLKNKLVWECACGNGNLIRSISKITKCIGTDILTGQDFLTWTPPKFDMIITNPPFSLKQEFLQRCYELRKPFALLLPLTTFETIKRQALFRKYGLEVIFMPKRINFETPHKIQNSSSWFATAWFTWKLGIGKEITFYE